MATNDNEQLYPTVTSLQAGDLIRITRAASFGQATDGPWYVRADNIAPGISSIAAGAGITLTPDPIIATGTVAITNTAVTPATYGNSTNVATFTVNARGQLTFAGNVAIAPSVAFPSGTTMLFVQTAAPTGWTKSATHNDKALRVVSGTASSGGTNAFSTVMAQTVTGAHTLTSAEMPSHTHTVTDPTHSHGTADAGNNFIVTGGTGSGANAAVGGGVWIQQAATGAAATGITNANTGGGGTHTHTMTMAIQYVDVIIAVKD